MSRYSIKGNHYGWSKSHSAFFLETKSNVVYLDPVYGENKDSNFLSTEDFIYQLELIDPDVDPDHIFNIERGIPI